MYQLIYVLVNAPTHDSALAAGRIVFNQLVCVDPHVAVVFDYYVTFDEENTTVAGRARWGNLPVAARVDSEEGTLLLEQGWEATEQEFKRNLTRVKEGLEEHSDEAIMRDVDLVRHAFH